MAFGYLFWFIVSKITTPQIVGVSSTVISIGTILATVAAIGIPIGVQRFLGKSFSEQKIVDVKVFIKISLIFTVIGIVGCSITILVAHNWFYTTFKIDSGLIMITIALIASSAIVTLLRSIVIATLNTKMLPLIMILSTIAKIAVAVILVLIGAGALGIMIGFTLFPILGSVILSVTIMKILRQLPQNDRRVDDFSFKKTSKLVLTASGASWLPYVIHIASSYFGPLLVFTSNGESQAGVYFIAYSFFNALYAIMSVLFTIAYPTLSSMHDGRKRLAWRVTKISLIISVPLSSALIFYSKDIMQFFGKDYVVGAPSLEVLLLSTVPFLVMNGVNALVNSYGNYRQVLAIGIGANIPTAILYFLLVPIFSNGIGAALSYTVGSIVGLILSVVVSRKIRMHIFWKDIGFILAVPSAIGFLLSYFHANYIIGTIVTLALSYFLLLRLKVITRVDINDSMAIIPPRIANPALKMWNLFSRKSRFL